MAIVFPSGTLSGPTKVLQVVQDWDGSVDVRTGGTTGTFYQFGGLSASITPSSSSNKVLVIAHLSGYTQYDGGIRINRSGTVVGSNTLASNRPRCIVEFPTTPRSNETSTNAFIYLDSPSTTSSRTYTIESLWNGYTQYINRTGSHSDTNGDAVTASNLILMEIAG